MPVKLNLSPIKVESFVTSLDNDEKKRVNGGVHTRPVEACHPDTNMGCTIDPQCPTISCHETCQTCELCPTATCETCDTCNDCSYLCISVMTECPLCDPQTVTAF